MKATQKGFLNILYGTLGQIIVLAISVITPLLVLENFGSEVNGLLRSTEQIFTYLSLLEAGIGYASLQALYKPVAEDDKNEVSAIMAATKIYYDRTGFLYTIAIVLFAVVYPIIVTNSLPYFLVVGIVLLGGLGGRLNYFYQAKYILLMQAEGYSFVTQRINIIINILINISKIVLLLSGCGILAVQASYFLMQVVRTVFYLFYVRKNYQDINFNIKPDFDAVSQKDAVFVHQISYMIFSSTDILLLTFLTQDLKIVSVYSIYIMIVNTLWTMVQSVAGGFDFRLGQIFAIDKEQYCKLFHTFEILHLTLIFAVMSALYVVFLPFMSLYTRNVTDINYLNSWYPILFVLGPILNQGRNAENSSITFAGHFEQTKKYSIIETSINLLVSVGGIMLLGLPGALIGTISASIYRTVNVIWYCYNHIIPGSCVKTVKRWLYCFIVFILLLIAEFYFPVSLSSYQSIIVVAILSGVLFIVIYGGGLYLLNTEEQPLVRDLLKTMIHDVLEKIIHSKNA